MRSIWRHGLAVAGSVWLAACGGGDPAGPPGSDAGQDSSPAQDAGVDSGLPHIGAVAAADRSEGAVPLRVRFDASGSQGPDLETASFRWDFGDGAVAEGVAPLHVFTTGGTHVVELTVEAPGWETSTDSIEMVATEGAPESHREIYRELTETLTELEMRLRDEGGDTPLTAELGAELLVANPHRGEDLLEPQALAGCLLFLDRFRELGIDGVTISVSYPILLEDFPRSDEYLEFYRDVVAEARDRGMTVAIETGLLFPSQTTLDIDYSGLTLDEYFAGRLEHVRILADELSPDFLTFGNEPSVESSLVGLPISADRYVEFVRDVLEVVPAGSVQLGAGTGSWDDAIYVRRFAEETDLDYIDLHVFPLRSSATSHLEAFREMADLATANGKGLVVTEAWLYKATASEIGAGLDWSDVFGRDVFDFYEPLDESFLRVLALLARAHDAAYVTPFWTHYFFAYLPWEEGLDHLSTQELHAANQQLVIEALLAGEFTGIGRLWGDLATGVADP